MTKSKPPRGVSKVTIEFALGTVAATTLANTVSESSQITYELIEGSNLALELFLDVLKDQAYGLRKAIVNLDYCSYEDLICSVYRAAEVLQATIAEQNASGQSDQTFLAGALF